MKQHEVWLIKARNDIKSSKKLLEGEDPILDTAIYHTQQCAEKALKAYLAYKNNKIEKTHDVGHLVSLCSRYDPEFNQLMDDADNLNPFSTFFNNSILSNRKMI